MNFTLCGFALCKVFPQTNCHYKPTNTKGEIHFINDCV